MDNTKRVEALIRELDKQREAYMDTFQKVHELLAQNLAATAPTTGLPKIEARSPTRQSLSRGTSEPSSEVPRSSTLPSSTSFKTSSVSKTTGLESEEDDDGDLYVQTPLEPQGYNEEGLRNHLKSYSWSRQGRVMLDGVVGHPARLSQTALIPNQRVPTADRSHLTDCQVYDVGPDGSPLPVEKPQIQQQYGQAMAVWHLLKELNPPSKERQAVGRITILREPSPILFGAVHYTMHKDIDVDEIIHHLYSAEVSSASMYDRAFDQDVRHQRSFVYNFEYFTLIGDKCEPMKWQLAAGQEDRKAGHIAITRCSSTMALVLYGPAIKEIKNPARRKMKERGYIYDPWSSWQVLNIQCYPDVKASLNVHDSTKHYVNGPDAFLNTLLGEFRDARGRFGDITKKISRRVRPPLEFMFDADLRDRLLFEDDEYSMARRYFWAHQTLGIMNESIKAMIDAFEDNFPPEVWEGKHKTLWPLLDQESSRNKHFKKKMGLLKTAFDSEMQSFKKLIDENNDRREEIEGLREDLFTGTSIQESRKSVKMTETTVQQGHNIKVLTLVSIFFLPLTFVTSVFGMTNMPTNAHFVAFGIVTAVVCIPFFVLVGTLNTTKGMSFFRSASKAIVYHIVSVFAWLFRCGRPAPGLATAKTFDSQSTASPSMGPRRWSAQRRPMRNESEQLISRADMQRRLETVGTAQTAPRSPPPPPVAPSRLAQMWTAEKKEKGDERKRRLTYSEDV